MRKLFRLWKVIVLDTLGVLFMIAALLTGWLPGPGGIPLFILGLSLLAINHEWAKRYIDKVEAYVSKIGEMVFSKNPKVELAYDLISPLVIAAGVFIIWQHNAAWTVSLGIVCFFTGFTLLIGNRGRWTKIKRALKQKR